MATRTTKGTEGVETPSLNELLRQLLEKEGKIAPQGWCTAHQLAKAWGLERRHCSRVLERMVGAGIMQRKKYVSKTVGPRGVMASMWHYAKTSI